MKKLNRQYLLVFLAPLFLAANCNKKDSSPEPPPPPPSPLVFTGALHWYLPVQDWIIQEH